MANTIQHKRSSTASAIPTSGSLSAGELAVNTADGKLFLKKDDNTIVRVGQEAAGSNTQIQFNNSGVLGADDGLVYDSANEILRVRSHGTNYFTIGAGPGGGSEVKGYGKSLIITATDSDVEINASNGGVVISSPAVFIDGVITGTDTTASASSHSGALIIAGGVGIAGDMFIDGQIDLGAGAILAAPSATALAIKSTVPAGTGVTPTVQIICPSANFTLLNQTATQPVFNTGKRTITLQAATTYMFDGQYLLTNGTTSHTTLLSFVLTTATITNCTWTTQNANSSAANTVISGMSSVMFNSVAGGAINGGSGGANTIIRFQGIMRVNAGGTMVPNIAFGTAPGGTNTTLVGSYIKFYPIGSNTIDFVGTAIG